MTFLRACAVVSLLAVSSFICYAQDNPNLENGIKPFGSYDGGNIDSVSITNGNVGIHVPLFSYPQRGHLKLDFWLAANSKSWTVVSSADPNNPGQVLYQWHPYGPGGIVLENSLDFHIATTFLSSTNSIKYTSLNLTTPDGSTHWLNQTAAGSNYYETSDTSGYAFIFHPSGTGWTGQSLIAREISIRCKTPLVVLAQN